MKIFSDFGSTTLSHDCKKKEMRPNADVVAIEKYLVEVLRAPSDRPLFSRVVATTHAAIEAYAKSLLSPSATFIAVRNSVAHLSRYINGDGRNSIKPLELEFPLMRRLMPHPEYALCVSLSQVDIGSFALEFEAAGLAIAFALATGSPVDATFVNAIRRGVAPKLFSNDKSEKRASTWQSSYIKKRSRAAEIFENGTGTDPASANCPRLFDVRARFELTRKMRYSPARQRQAVLDRRHQSGTQVLQSSKSLIERAVDGDETALLLILSFSTGLSLRTTLNMPLAPITANDAWLCARY